MDKSEINSIIENQLHYFEQQAISLKKVMESFKEDGLGRLAYQQNPSVKKVMESFKEDELGRLAYQQNPSVKKVMESFKEDGLGRLAYQQKLSAALGKSLDINTNPDLFLSLQRTIAILNQL